MSDWLEALRAEQAGYVAAGREDRAAEVQAQIDLITGAAAERAADPPEPKKVRQRRG